MAGGFTHPENIRDKGDSIIEVSNVSTTYAGELKPAIKSITFSVSEGEFALIVGPNGVGKTTLLETMLGLLKPSTGEIKLMGYRIPSEAMKARQFCSYLPQDFMKPAGEPFVVKDVVSMGLTSRRRVFQKLNEKERKRIFEVLEVVKATELANRPVGRLSAGQQQRVLLARALIRDPRILFLDEPFSSLDKETRSDLALILKKLNTKEDLTILMVSHEESTTSKIKYHKIIEMRDGTLVKW